MLLAKLAGAMKANLSKAAGLFNAPASQVARLVAALQEKKAAEAPSAARRLGSRRSRRRLGSRRVRRLGSAEAAEDRLRPRQKTRLPPKPPNNPPNQ